MRVVNHHTKQFMIALIRCFYMYVKNTDNLVLHRTSSDFDFPGRYVVSAPGIEDPAVGNRRYRYVRIDRPRELVIVRWSPTVWNAAVLIEAGE